MPIGLSPDDTCNFSLACDMQQPESTRPVFEIYYLTTRKLRQFNKARDAVHALFPKDGELPPEDVRDAAFVNALRPVIAGWRNMTTGDPETAKAFGVELVDGKAALPFKIELLADLLTVDERWELLERCTDALRATEGEKRELFFSSPATTGSMASVPSAPAGNASTSPA
jgi:hypothetical protein